MFGDMREANPVGSYCSEIRQDFLLPWLDKAKFLASEHALAVILPSRDGADSGGSGGTILDDQVGCSLTGAIRDGDRKL